LSNQFRLTLIFTIGALLVVVMTLQMTAASFIDGQYLPVGHDAFYHARRILDAVATGRLFQFDTLMHAPEGDWVTWPWAYDFLLAKAVALLTRITGASDPVAVLMHLPPVLGVLTTGLVVAICAQLRLSLVMTGIATACFALHAYTQYQFGVGALDHHGAEQLATLGTLLLGLRWFSLPASPGRACALGIGLGTALGIHAGLFILQVPVLAALCLGWQRRDAIPPAAANWFVAGLICSVLVVLIPAETFWQGRFVIYYLSWFHLYVSAATCVIVLYVSRRPFNARSLLVLVGLAVALAVPLLAVVAFSRGFLSGDLSTIRDIDEIQSPFAIARQENGLRRINQVYTLLVWISPLTLITALVLALRERTLARTYFWLASAFGLGLLLLQLRLGSFGVPFLYLPLLVLSAMAMEKWPRANRGIAIGLVALLVAAYYPTVRYQLFGGRVPAMDQQFSTLRPLLRVLREACAKDPGVVLAEPGDGHLIRYFTNCAVISNNFRLTPMDIEKVVESLDLIAMPLDKMRARNPRVKYVVARLVSPNESTDPVLFRQLLSTTEKAPADVHTLAEMKVTAPDGKVQKFLGIYRLTE